MHSGFQITNVKMIRIIVARKHDVTAIGLSFSPRMAFTNG